MFWEKKDTNCVVKSIEINLVCLKNPTMLPTPLENLVGFFAFGEGRYNLDEEVDFCAANRGMVPDSFLQHCMPLDSYRASMRPTLSCYMVKNPLRTDNPFFPWALVDSNAMVFSNTFFWWKSRILKTTYQKLKTYRSTFKKHVEGCISSNKNCEREWNCFVNRYLATDVLMKPESYDTEDHGVLFVGICEELSNAGYLSPKISLPPRLF